MANCYRTLKYFQKLNDFDYQAILRCFHAKFQEIQKGNNIVNIGDKTDYIYIIAENANQSYKYWKDSHKDRLCLQYIKNSLKNLGFNYLTTTINKVSGVHIYKIDKEKFNELIENLSPKIDDDGELINDLII